MDSVATEVPKELANEISKELVQAFVIRMEGCIMQTFKEHADAVKLRSALQPHLRELRFKVGREKEKDALGSVLHTRVQQSLVHEELRGVSA